MMDHYVLNTKRKIPKIGFGTWELTPDKSATEAVLFALKAGYRIIDTARIYGNEAGVGDAIRQSEIPRNKLFVTTKVWNDAHGYQRTLDACSQSLERLQLEYLDLYLIHWPATLKRFDSWQAMEELYGRGIIKAAGVSNFTVRHLQELANFSTFTPAVNQVEFHPFIYEQQKELLAYCAAHRILIEAYSPLSRISHEHSSVIEHVARLKHRTPQQIVIRWCIQHGTLPLVRSRDPQHIASNREVFDFELNDLEMKQLNSISDGKRVTWDPNDMR